MKTMKPEEIKEFETLQNIRDRAKWLLEKGVTAKPTIDRATLETAFTAFAAGVALPGHWKTKAEAIAGGTAWLAKKAELPDSRHGIQ